MLAVLISGTQTISKARIQLEDNNGINGQEKTTKMFFTVMLRATLHKESIEKDP